MQGVGAARWRGMVAGEGALPHVQLLGGLAQPLHRQLRARRVARHADALREHQAGAMQLAQCGHPARREAEGRVGQQIGGGGAVERQHRLLADLQQQQLQALRALLVRGQAGPARHVRRLGGQLLQQLAFVLPHLPGDAGGRQHRVDVRQRSRQLAAGGAPRGAVGLPRREPRDRHALVVHACGQLQHAPGLVGAGALGVHRAHPMVGLGDLVQRQQAHRRHGRGEQQQQLATQPKAAHQVLARPQPARPGGGRCVGSEWGEEHRAAAFRTARSDAASA